MNWKKGMFRVWIFVSLLWVLPVSWLAWDGYSKGQIFGLNYQYVEQFKKDPIDTAGGLPLYDKIFPPRSAPRPTQFHEIGWQYLEKWRHGPFLQKYDFDDGSSLYLDIGLSEFDKVYLCRVFWEQRWARYFASSWPWAAGALLPPLALLAFGWIIAWVARGFRKQPSVLASQLQD